MRPGRELLTWLYHASSRRATLLPTEKGASVVRLTVMKTACGALRSDQSHLYQHRFPFLPQEKTSSTLFPKKSGLVPRCRRDRRRDGCGNSVIHEGHVVNHALLLATERYFHTPPRPCYQNGKSSSSEGTSSSHYLASAQKLYDSANGSWSDTGSLALHPRATHGDLASQWHCARRWRLSKWRSGSLAETELDTSQWNWTRRAISIWHAPSKATLLSDGKVLVAGGMVPARVENFTIRSRANGRSPATSISSAAGGAR